MVPAMFQRALLLPYLCVGGGTLVGLAVGVFVIDFEPAFVGWLFGGGAGLTGGAFVAAITSNEPLVGGPAPRRRRRG